MNIYHCVSTVIARELCRDRTASLGDILVVQSERVVGIADLTPFAITICAGALDSLPDGPEGDALRQQFATSIATAQRVAQDMAFRLDPLYAIKAYAIANANAYLHNAAVPSYSQLARAASVILETLPSPGTEREGDALGVLRRLVDAIPCIEYDPPERGPAAPDHAQRLDGRSGGDAV